MKQIFASLVNSSRILVRRRSSASLPLGKLPPHRLFEDKSVGLLLSCNNPRELHRVHAQVIVHGFQDNKYISPKIVAISCELNEVFHARKVLDRNPEPNVPLWNAMLKGYYQNEMYMEVVALFGEINSIVIPNCFTFPIVLKSFHSLIQGEQVQNIVIKSGFQTDPFVGTALIDMYSGGHAIECAFKAFSDMLHQNIVAWTSMINGYLSCNDIDSARRLFSLAPDRDIVLWNTMMSGYIQRGNMTEARNLFNQIPNRDVMTWNTLLVGYADNGDVDSCAALFEEIPEKNIFSWNGLISGYASRCLPRVLHG